jgi:hypothetical protein
MVFTISNKPSLTRVLPNKKTVLKKINKNGSTKFEGVRKSS